MVHRCKDGFEVLQLHPNHFDSDLKINVIFDDEFYSGSKRVTDTLKHSHEVKHDVSPSYAF